MIGVGVIIGAGVINGVGVKLSIGALVVNRVGSFGSLCKFEIRYITIPVFGSYFCKLPLGVAK